MRSAAFALLAVACCRQHPVAPPTADDSRVYGELVECGALAPGDGGVAAVAAERKVGNFPWLDCLYSGKTTAECSAPCSSP